MTTRATPLRIKWGTPFRFRVKLTLLLMVVVCSVTALALFFTQRAQQADNQRSLEDKFQIRRGVLLGAQEAREAQVSQQCRVLARSVRIQAALEEGDVDDLYANARVELRDVLAEGGAPLPNQAATAPRATFLRFITADGKLLTPTGTEPAPWEEQLVAACQGAASQQIGYLPIPTPGGEPVIHEIVTTPILGPDGEKTAALVLGFPPNDSLIKADAEIKTGLWLDGRLELPSLPADERAALSGTIAKAVQAAPQGDNNFTVQVQGEPYLLFCKVLNPGSRFAPAYEICLYSLADLPARQQRLRWRIVGIAALVLVVGLVVSHAFSARLSRPVEQLAEDSAQNLARRQEAELARARTEQKYQSIFENAVEGIFLLDPDGRCLSANPAMARIFGFDAPPQLVSQMTGPLYVDLARGEEFMRRVKTDGVVSNFDCEMKRRDGSTIWISKNARAVRDGAGALLHLEGTIEDITQRKQAADTLRTLNAELEKAVADLKATQHQVIQQERLRALGQMASGIAHDFNNSLMPVMGFAELLLAHPEILEDRKKTTGYLEMIRTAAKDAASIVARLREFYRTNENSDVFAAIDLAHLARQAVSLTQPKWKDQAQAGGVEIRIVEECGEVPAISGDESALREVFTNLIFNAVDAMPGGGTITVRTRCETGRVAVEIADTGAGMSEEVRQRCLEPFFTTKGDRGTGLGLAMVFGIVQRHGGTIDIVSRLGEGTAIVLRFPVRATDPAGATAVAAPLLSRRNLRILLVDDEPQVREVLAAFLEIDGHTVQCADQGADGLRRFRAEAFDLVITDKAMPGMSGEQLALEIKALSPTMPIVLLSGFNSTGENETIAGVNVIASKPITMPALQEAIRQAMELS